MSKTRASEFLEEFWEAFANQLSISVRINKKFSQQLSFIAEATFLVSVWRLATFGRYSLQVLIE